MDKKYAEYLLNKTKEDYNLIADDFSSKREGIWEETKFLIDDYVKIKEKILDLGCGNGRYFPLFKEKGVDYFGIDNSEKLIEIARDRYREGRFQTGDVLNLMFPDDYFDKIYSIAVLHHVPSEELRVNSLKEVKRVLRPGGLLIATVWKFHQPKEFYFLFKYTLLKLIGKSKLDWKDVFEPWGKRVERYYHWFSKEELGNLLKKAGLKIKEIGVIKNKRGNRQNIYLIAEK